MALSEGQQKNVWEGWLGSEIRANYFAELCRRYQVTQRIITWATLLASSGAAATVLGQIPDSWLVVRPVLVVLTAGLSLWSLVVNYNRHVTDCSDLHFRWNQLSNDYEALWLDMYSAGAPAKLGDLRRREAELSKSAASFPNRPSLMLKWERYVVAQHGTTAMAS